MALIKNKEIFLSDLNMAGEARSTIIRCEYNRKQEASIRQELETNTTSIRQAGKRKEYIQHIIQLCAV